MKQFYFIGGSPCSGKSTIAEMLVAEFGFLMYKCDDHLDRYMDIAAANGSAIMKKFKTMNLDETWLRDVEQQVHEEFEFYREASAVIRNDLVGLPEDRPVLAEGAALTPWFAREFGLALNRYVAIVPTRTFQQENYSRREWVPHYLSGCSDPAKAFQNWMERDCRFAETVRREAERSGMNIIVVDGVKTIEENYQQVLNFLNLTSSQSVTGRK